MDECRVVFTSDDGTVIGVDDGREVFQSKMHAGFKTVLQVLAMALLLFIGIPIGMILVDLSLKVLAWGRH